MTKKRKLFRPRVSNTLALFSATLLLMSAGIGAYSGQALDGMEQNTNVVPSLLRLTEPASANDEDKVRSLNVTKLLFRHG